MLFFGYECSSSFEPRNEKTYLMSYATNKGADQPAHRHSLISTFVVRCLDSIIPPILAKSKISRLEQVSAAEQAGLSLTLSPTPEDRFSRDVAHFITVILKLFMVYMYSMFSVLFVNHYARETTVY